MYWDWWCLLVVCVCMCVCVFVCVFVCVCVCVYAGFAVTALQVLNAVEGNFGDFSFTRRTNGSFQEK
jgi:hypothetical protein